MKGNHDDKACEKYYKYSQLYYINIVGQELLAECQFRGNKSKIQSLIRKVHIDSDGSVTAVKFVN